MFSKFQISETKQLDSSCGVQRKEPALTASTNYYYKPSLSVAKTGHIATQVIQAHGVDLRADHPAICTALNNPVSIRLHCISSYRPDHYLNFNLEIQVYLE